MHNLFYDKKMLFLFQRVFSEYNICASSLHMVRAGNAYIQYINNCLILQQIYWQISLVATIEERREKQTWITNIHLLLSLEGFAWQADTEKRREKQTMSN